MFKLAYSMGSLAALIKLGATQVMQALTPAQKAMMERMTGFGAPAAQLPPTLKQTQQAWRQFSQSQIPELIAASEQYELPGSRRYNPEGLRRSALQRQKLDKWLQAKGPQILNPESIVGRTLPSPPPVPSAGTGVGTVAEPLASTAQRARTGRAATRVAPEATGKGMQFAKTLLRRFAHV
jgi:hypothetical protein